jgi:hypothetical protein
MSSLDRAQSEFLVSPWPHPVRERDRSLSVSAHPSPARPVHETVFAHSGNRTPGICPYPDRDFAGLLVKNLGVFICLASVLKYDEH